jgi:hypothetical protein
VVFAKTRPRRKPAVDISWQKLFPGTVSKPCSQKLYKEKREKYMKNYAEKEGY